MVAELAPKVNYALPKPWLSHSQVYLYLDCPACYQETYVQGRRERVSASMPVGSGFHAAVAHARRAVQAGRTYQLADCVEQGIAGFRLSVAGADRDGEIRGEPPEVDWKEYGAAEKAEAHLIDLAEQAVDAVVEREKPIGLAAVEAEIDFADTFPFPFRGWLDVMTNANEIKDLKTAAKHITPTAHSALQLTTYALPWFFAKEAVTLAVDQVVKQKRVDVRYFPLQVNGKEYVSVWQEVMLVAEGISRGYFPARPGWGCDARGYEHGLPKFIALP